MTLWAQRLALAHDREKEEARRADEQKARAWSMFFKIHHVLEATTALADSIDQARRRANERGEALWQTLQFPSHDWEKVDHNNEELLLLIEHKQLDIMQRYQEATSGMGRHHGIEGFREFSNQRGVVFRGEGDMIDAFYAPYAKAAVVVSMALSRG